MVSYDTRQVARQYDVHSFIFTHDICTLFANHETYPTAFLDRDREAQFTALLWLSPSPSVTLLVQAIVAPRSSLQPQPAGFLPQVRTFAGVEVLLSPLLPWQIARP